MQDYPPLEMPNNNRAKFDLSKLPPELKKVTLDHLLSYRTYKQKECAHKKISDIKCSMISNPKN